MQSVKKIQLDINNLVIAYGPFADGIVPAVDIPVDFYETAGFGKYKYENNVFVEVVGWVMPDPPPEV